MTLRSELKKFAISSLVVWAIGTALAAWFAYERTEKALVTTADGRSFVRTWDGEVTVGPNGYRTDAPISSFIIGSVCGLVPVACVVLLWLLWLPMAWWTTQPD